MQDLVEVLSWDTRFFGFAVGRVTSPSLDRAQLDAVDRQSRTRNIRLLYWLADPRRTDPGDIAEVGGFRFMDFRLEFERRLENSPDTTASHDRVRPVEPRDLPMLRPIAAAVHTDSRFARDALLRGKAAELFERWIERDAARPDGAVFVADTGCGACGYCTCHPQPDRPGTAQIGLIGVRPGEAGRGLGRELVAAAVRWCAAGGFETVQVVTQGSNIAAQRLYQSQGFKTSGCGVWFHRSLGPDQ